MASTGENPILIILKERGYSYGKVVNAYARHLRDDANFGGDWSTCLTTAHANYKDHSPEFMEFVKGLPVLEVLDGSKENIRKTSSPAATRPKTPSVPVATMSPEGANVRLQKSPTLPPHVLETYNYVKEKGQFTGTIDEFLATMVTEGSQAKWGIQPVIMQNLGTKQESTLFQQPGTPGNGNQPTSTFNLDTIMQMQQKQLEMDMQRSMFQEQQLRIDERKAELEERTAAIDRKRRGISDETPENRGVPVEIDGQIVYFNHKDFIEYKRATSSQKKGENLIPYMLGGEMVELTPEQFVKIAGKFPQDNAQANPQMQQLQDQIKQLQQENQRIREGTLERQIDEMRNQMNYTANRNQFAELASGIQNFQGLQSAMGVNPQAGGPKSLAQHQMDMDNKKMDTTLGLLTGEVHNFHSRMDNFVEIVTPGLKKLFEKKVGEEGEQEEELSEDELVSMQAALEDYGDEEEGSLKAL